MIMKENVTRYLLALSKYATKRGRDSASKAELIQAIEDLTEYAAPVNIYVNEVDNVNIPDVAVVPVYMPGFSDVMMDADSINLTPKGYTIEIASYCFTKFSDEELGAVILHDILQNVLSDTAKLRLLRAWTATGDKRGDKYLIALENLSMFDDMMYMAYLQICITPFRVPILAMNYVATDEVLKAVGLADAYESYLGKVLPMSKDSVESIMDRQVEEDRRNMCVVLDACVEGQELGYIKYVYTYMPLITLDKALGIPRPHHKHPMPMIRDRHMHDIGIKGKSQYMAMAESYNSPNSDYDIRFSIDKIINSMRYAETESERDVILFKIKQLTLKIIKIRTQLEKTKNPSNTIYQRIVLLQEYQAELDELRQKVVNMEIKEKRWSVYMKGDMPEGYDM